MDKSTKAGFLTESLSTHSAIGNENSRTAITEEQLLNDSLLSTEVLWKWVAIQECL